MVHVVWIQKKTFKTEIDRIGVVWHKGVTCPTVFRFKTEKYLAKVLQTLMIRLDSLNIIIDHKIKDAIFIFIQNWEAFLSAKKGVPQ